MTSTHPKSAWAPHMPKMYCSALYCALYNVHCTVQCTLYGLKAVFVTIVIAVMVVVVVVVLRWCWWWW